MWNRLKVVLAICAISAGGSILLMEVFLLGSDIWNVRFAALREPVDLFSESCDVSLLEEMDIVSGTVCDLYGRYDYTYDDYVSDIAYYYVLPIDMGGRTYYMGIRETKGRKELFRKLSVKTEFDVGERGLNVKPFQDAAGVSSGQADAERESVFVEGLLFRMNEQQYKRFQTWLDKAGYLDEIEGDGQVLPYYIEERNIAKYKRYCIGGLIWTAAGIVMIAGSIAVLVRSRNRRRSQTQITIGDVVYEKLQLTRVNQLIEHLEMMQAVQELSRITGLDMIQAEKIVRRWYRYWY
ncbi:MAG: hypothetical protein K2N95_08885 [Lachnospiraceae bacterium]|nr:hypothetical protein [Lachnospiraceae bacterium]